MIDEFANPRLHHCFSCLTGYKAAQILCAYTQPSILHSRRSPSFPRFAGRCRQQSKESQQPWPCLQPRSCAGAVGSPGQRRQRRAASRTGRRARSPPRGRSTRRSPPRPRPRLHRPRLPPAHVRNDHNSMVLAGMHMSAHKHHGRRPQASVQAHYRVTGDAEKLKARCAETLVKRRHHLDLSADPPPGRRRPCRPWRQRARHGTRMPRPAERRAAGTRRKRWWSGPPRPAGHAMTQPGMACRTLSLGRVIYCW